MKHWRHLVMLEDYRCRENLLWQVFFPLSWWERKSRRWSPWSSSSKKSKVVLFDVYLSSSMKERLFLCNIPWHQFWDFYSWAVLHEISQRNDLSLSLSSCLRFPSMKKWEWDTKRGQRKKRWEIKKRIHRDINVNCSSSSFSFCLQCSVSWQQKDLERRRPTT
jgi:hypothetical protein